MIRLTMADPEEKRQELAKFYASMTEEELRKLAEEAWSLTEIGKETLRSELARRGLKIELAAAPPEIQSGILVLLRRFRDLPDALLAQNVLDSTGMESYLFDEITIRMDWLWSNLLGGIKLCVPPEDADDAVRLLSSDIPEKFSYEGAADLEQPRCPQCQSLNISFRDLDMRIACAGILFLKFPIIVHRRRWICQSCGHIGQPHDDDSKQNQ